MSYTIPKHKKRKRNKKHGFLARSQSPTGKRIITRRRRKKRTRIGV